MLQSVSEAKFKMDPKLQLIMGNVKEIKNNIMVAKRYWKRT